MISTSLLRSCVLALLSLTLVVATPPLSAAAEEDQGQPAVGPHGGCLVPLQDTGVAEFRLDADRGQFHLFLWDESLENPVRSKQQTMFLKLDIPGQTQARLAMLQPQANASTGEEMGDTSHFAGGAEQLKGATDVGVIVDALSVAGKAFRLIDFRYPEGLTEAWPAWQPPTPSEAEAP